VACLLCIAVLSLVNAHRAQPLTYNPALAELGSVHGGLLARARTVGCPSPEVGENTAWGTSADGTPASIVQAWLHSPPHRAIMLDPRFRYTGITVRRDGDRTSYAEYFATHCNR